MSDITLNWTIASGEDTIRYSKTYSGSAAAHFSEEIATGSTNTQVNIAIDVSAVKAFVLVSDQDVTVKTNSTSSPNTTFTLEANHPYTWDTDSEDAFLLAVDVTVVYITNASGATATVRCRCVYDATP